MASCLFVFNLLKYVTNPFFLIRGVLKRKNGSTFSFPCKYIFCLLKNRFLYCIDLHIMKGYSKISKAVEMQAVVVFIHVNT